MSFNRNFNPNIWATNIPNMFDQGQQNQQQQNNMPFNQFFNSSNSMNNNFGKNGMNNNFGPAFQQHQQFHNNNMEQRRFNNCPNNDFGGNRKHIKRNNQFEQHINNKVWKKNNQRKDLTRDEQDHDIANFANPENPNSSRNQSFFVSKEENFKNVPHPSDSKFNEHENFKQMDSERLSSPKPTEGSLLSSSSLGSESTTKNPKLEAICNKSATEVTKKLFSQLKTMDKSNIKDIINNPKIKYETALKQHARIKLRAQMHKQMKALTSDQNLDGKDQFQLEADVAVDSDKMPNELMDEIGKKLDINMFEDGTQSMDLCDGDSAGEDRAFEVVSKNLDVSKDLFLSAEMLLMGATSLFEYPEENKEEDESTIEDGYQNGISEDIDQMRSKNPNLVAIRPAERVGPKPVPRPKSTLPDLPPLPVDAPEPEKILPELNMKPIEMKRTISNSAEMESFLNKSQPPPLLASEKEKILTASVAQIAVKQPTTPSLADKPSVNEKSPNVEIPSTPKREEILPPRTPLSESGSQISVTPSPSATIPVMVTTQAMNFHHANVSQLASSTDGNDWESNSHIDNHQLNISMQNMQHMPNQGSNMQNTMNSQNTPFASSGSYNANNNESLSNISGPRERPMTYRDFKNAQANAQRINNSNVFDDQMGDRNGDKNRFGNNNNNYRPGPAGRNNRGRVFSYDKDQRRNDQPKFNRFGPNDKSPLKKNDTRGVERDRFGNYVRPGEKPKEEDERILERPVHLNYAPDKLNKGGLDAILKPQGFQFKGSFKKGAAVIRKDSQRRSKSKSPSNKYRSRSRDRSSNNLSKSRSRSTSTTRNSIRSASNTGDQVELLISGKPGANVEVVRSNLAALKKMSEMDSEISKLIERMHGIDKVINNLQSERSIIQKTFSKLQHDRKLLLDALLKNVSSASLISSSSTHTVSDPTQVVALSESEKIRKRKSDTILKLQDQVKRKKGIHDDETKTHKKQNVAINHKENDDDQLTKPQEGRNPAKVIKPIPKISPLQQLISSEKKKFKKHRLDLNNKQESESKSEDVKDLITDSPDGPENNQFTKPKKSLDNTLESINKAYFTKKNKTSSQKSSKIFKLDEDQVKRAVLFAQRESLFYDSDRIIGPNSDVKKCTVNLRNIKVSDEAKENLAANGFVSIDQSKFEKNNEIVPSKGLRSNIHEKINEQKVIENASLDEKTKEEKQSRPPTPDFRIIDETTEVDPLAIDSYPNGIDMLPVDPPSCKNSISIMYDYTEWNGNFIEHEMPIVHLKVVNDKYVLCASEDGKIFKYLLETCELEDVFTHHNEICNFFIYDDAEFVYSASSDGFMHKFRLNCFQSVVHTENVAEPLQSLDLAWDRLFIAAKNGNIYKYRTKKQILTSTPLCNVDAPILCIKAAKEGARRILLIASRLNPVQVRDADSGLLLRSFFGDSTVMTYNIYDMMIDGHTLHCGTSKNEIYSLDFTSGDLKETRKCGSAAVCLKLYNNYLVAACYDGFLYFYDKKSSELLHKVQGPGNMLLSMDTYKNRIIASTKNNKTLKMKIIPTTST